MARRPLERERVSLDGGRRTTQLMRVSLGGAVMDPGLRLARMTHVPNHSPVVVLMTRWLHLVLLVLAAGCFPVRWDRAEVKPRRLWRRQHVKIWSGDSVFTWHAVRITSDSVTGVPREMSTKCDSCRLGLARYAVDSIRLRDPSSPAESRFIGAGLIILVFFGWEHPR